VNQGGPGSLQTPQKKHPWKIWGMGMEYGPPSGVWVYVTSIPHTRTFPWKKKSVKSSCFNGDFSQRKSMIEA